jgi:hypothetical protein
MTIFAPPKTLQAYPVTVDVADIWQDDGTSYVGYPYTWRVMLNVTPQYHSDPELSMAYDSTSIVVGDWFSNRLGGAAWRIQSIESADGSSITCVMEDVDQFNTYADLTQNADGSPYLGQYGFFFSLDDENHPIFTPTPDQIQPQWQSDLISRFWYTLPSSGGGGGAPPATKLPLPDGTAAVGTSIAYAREDHVHPTDTSLLSLSGGIMTGPLTLAADPAGNLDAVSKQYVDTKTIDGGLL